MYCPLSCCVFFCNGQGFGFGHGHEDGGQDAVLCVLLLCTPLLSVAASGLRLRRVFQWVDFLRPKGGGGICGGGVHIFCKAFNVGSAVSLGVKHCLHATMPSLKTTWAELFSHFQTGQLARVQRVFSHMESPGQRMAI